LSPNFKKRLTTSKDGRKKQDAISQEKTKTTVFTRSNPGKGRPDLNLKLQGHQIEELMSLKILGLTLDHRLT
jgi:hypothetical protein